ncbi:MAG: DNA-3-methyladenine glycosylase [Nitrospinae bacterium RIFCSPLOWO2_12_FULL_47_7]|nr:MAG: DNA-3-methyladenine glycosylase [Nitrospinae bacterium RIFCSPLOWO2_12_FULL_47_7]
MKINKSAKTNPPNHKEILAHFDKRDPVISGVIRDVGPFRLKRNKNYFQVLCKAIIAQQISTRAADAIAIRFHGLMNGKAPSPGRVAGLSDESLRSIGFSRQKIAYVKDLSQHFLNKTIRPHQLPFLSNEEIIQTLTAVHGIGRWTAEMFLIFSLNRLDVLPVGDLGLRTALGNIYKMRSLPSLKRMRALGKKWHPCETIATWYAWRTLDANIVAY